MCTIDEAADEAAADVRMESLSRSVFTELCLPVLASHGIHVDHDGLVHYYIPPILLTLVSARIRRTTGELVYSFNTTD
jgi:hypothetical protein